MQYVGKSVTASAGDHIFGGRRTNFVRHRTAIGMTLVLVIRWALLRPLQAEAERRARAADRQPWSVVISPRS